MLRPTSFAPSSLPPSPRGASPRRFRPGTGLALSALLLCAACTSSSSAAPATPTTPTVAGSATPSSTATPSTAAATTSPAAAAAAADEACVQQAYDELTPAQRAGQLVMAGVPAGDPADGRALVKAERLGGAFLAGRTGDSPATIRKGLARLPGQQTRTATIGLLVAVDQEGGKVQSLRGSRWTAIPAATTQGRWSTATLTSRTRAWVKQLHSAGITLDLGPVADTVPASTAGSNPPIGAFDRQYGSTSPAVARAVATVSRTMRAGQVIPTVKHFPGLGRVRYNTDTSSRAVDRTTTATSTDLKPFQAGIDAGAGVVMVSSASYPKIDPDNLAVFSAPVITGLLRGRMNYQGVVMTDDVGRAVAVRSVPRGQRATRFIAAGGDLVLTVLPEQAPAMVDAIVTKASASKAFRAQVQASTLRVLRLKQSADLLTCT